VVRPATRHRRKNKRHQAWAAVDKRKQIAQCKYFLLLYGYCNNTK
jgi:hypothetical protein